MVLTGLVGGRAVCRMLRVGNYGNPNPLVVFTREDLVRWLDLDTIARCSHFSFCFFYLQIIDFFLRLCDILRTYRNWGSGLFSLFNLDVDVSLLGRYMIYCLQVIFLSDEKNSCQTCAASYICFSFPPLLFVLVLLLSSFIILIFHTCFLVLRFTIFIIYTDFSFSFFLFFIFFFHLHLSLSLYVHLPHIK